LETSFNALSKNIYFWTVFIIIYHAEEDLKICPQSLMCILNKTMLWSVVDMT